MYGYHSIAIMGDHNGWSSVLWDHLATVIHFLSTNQTTMHVIRNLKPPIRSLHFQRSKHGQVVPQQYYLYQFVAIVAISGTTLFSGHFFQSLQNLQQTNKTYKLQGRAGQGKAANAYCTSNTFALEGLKHRSQGQWYT